MSSVYSSVDKNKRETAVIFIGFIFFVTAVFYFASLAYFGDSSMLVFAFLFSFVSGFVGYYKSDSLVLAISGAREIKPEDSQYVHSLVENMCIASGLPKPKLYVINDTALNAFATGRSPDKGVICFTSGIIDRLEKRQLEGVIAHELSHIQNYDTRLMSVVAILVGTITLLVDWLSRGVFYRGSSSSRDDRSESTVGGILFIVGLLGLILSPIIANLIKLAIGRNREYLADSSAVLLTRNPKGLADALRIISMDTEVLEAANGATAHLYIANPLKNPKAANFLSGLFNTHPPVAERIKRLESM